MYTRKNKYKTPILIAALAVILSLSFAWPRLRDPHKETRRKWQRVGVECVNEGATRLLQHIHPLLSITVDGKGEPIPENIGMIPRCTAELHTHDGSGKIHVESPYADKRFTLGQFFAVWGKPIERPTPQGYGVKITADGVEVQDPANLILKDNQKIEVSYLPAEASAKAGQPD